MDTFPATPAPSRIDREWVRMRGDAVRFDGPYRQRRLRSSLPVRGLEAVWNIKSADFTTLLNFWKAQKASANKFYFTHWLTRESPCLSFDGVDDVVTSTLGTLWPATNWTVEFWFRWDGSTAVAFRHPFELGGSQRLTCFVHTVPTPKPLLAKWQISAVPTYEQGTLLADVVVGRLYHIALTFNGTTVLGYVDGVLAFTGTTAWNSSGSTNALRIGDAGGGTSVDGRIDEHRIWNVARTQTQIQNNKDKELFGDEASLVGYWKLNEACGRSKRARDYTTNKNHGTVSGALDARGATLTPAFLAKFLGDELPHGIHGPAGLRTDLTLSWEEVYQ